MERGNVLLNDVDGWGGQTVLTHHQHLIQQSFHERAGIQSQAEAAVVTTDTDMDTSLRDRLVRTCIPNNVERGGQMDSTLFNIRDNKRNVEWLLKQGLNGVAGAIIGTFRF